MKNYAGGLTRSQRLKIISFFLVFFPFFNSFGQDENGFSDAYLEVMAKTSAVNDPDRQVGEFDPSSSPSLPIGLVKEINDTRYIIAIDSAYFLNNAAYFSAYMAIEFPNSNKKIAFAAKNIQFNPKGVVGGDQAKLMLVSDHLIDLGPNTQLSLKGDGTNYVNWNCNGFESVNLHGAFLLSGNLLEAVSDPADTVKAEFTVNVQDLNNMVAAVSFTPFKIRGLDDFDFTVSNAYVDMSDYVNPLGVTMPSCYQEIYSDDINLWRGFYLKNFTIVLPEKISQGDDRTELYATDMFIDEAGVTGFIGAENVLSLMNGETDGNWGFSVDSLQIGLTTNELTSGKMTGDVEVPLMDNNAIHYRALIAKNVARGDADYLFSINTAEPVEVQCFSSTLELYPTTKLEMTVHDKKFKPKLTLNGTWTLDRENAKFEGIGFQNVTVIAQSPYVTQGVFSLISETPPETAKFPISINALGLGIYNSQPTIQASVGLNLGKEDDANNFSAVTSFKVITEVRANEISGKQEWHYDDFQISTIALEVNTTPFSLSGLIDFRKDDPIYGDGFEGALSMSIADVLDDIDMYCIFGKLPTYKYWAIDVSVPVNIPLTGGLKLNQLTGGLSYHMENTQSVDDIIDAARAPILERNPAMSPNYVPNDDYSIGFRAGVGYAYTPEKTLNGEVVFSIMFNASGGLASILLAGDAYMMVTKDERAGATNYAKGTVAIGYDNQERILDARLAVDAQFYNAFYADIWSQIYISPELWFFHLGTPTDQCTISLSNFASANGYFMFGQNLPPMALPPPQVAGVLGGMSDSRNEDAIALGNGIGTGMNLYVGFDQSIGWNDFSIYGTGYLGAGFDMTLYKYAPSAYCEESGGAFGANYWYLNGQLYAYGGINLGVAGTYLGNSFDVTLISASMAMLLQGKLPKPTYIYGGLNVQASLLGVFEIERTFDFEAGTNCTILD